MSTALAPMTVDEFLALPESDKFERWLVDGRLKKFRMSKRSPIHAQVSARLTAMLVNWADSRSENRPRVYNGDIYFLLHRQPDRSVGVDVAVASAEQYAALTADSQLIEGVPLLAVEVLSASDRTSRVERKIDLYLDSGTPLVWLVNPYRKIVHAYRTGLDPVLYGRAAMISGEPELPGLALRVADLFA